MLVIFLGAPGSGKGTISESLVKKNNFKHISTGDIFRKMINSETDLGNKLKELIENGNLVDDETTWEVAKNTLIKFDLEKDKLILDGYPRNINQAKLLEEYLKSISFEDIKIIYYDVSEKIIIDRLSYRRMCPICGKSYNLKSMKPKIDGVCDEDNGKLYQRKDDKNIQVRLKAYNDVTKPLINYYDKNKKLIILNAESSLSEILNKTLEVIK